MAWSKTRRISVMLVIDIIFFFVELISGLVVGSLALTADAFHMLNDIVSLIIGLWAVMLSTKSTTDKYSYGWLRAEILGAFFNAVFLIALCVSIVLEAVVRLFDPPVITSPQLILAVGCFGLASNLVGFVILGGHGHVHGPGGQQDGKHSHDHSHDHTLAHEQNLAEQGFRRAHSDDEDRRRFGIYNRFHNIEDMSFYPSSFRQELIAAADRTAHFDEQSGSDSIIDENTVESDGDGSEQAPLLAVATNDAQYGTANGARRNSSIHQTHHHSQPRKPGKKGGHSHDDMGMKTMLLHVIGDAVGNVGVMMTALVTWLTDWPGKYYADPVVSVLIALIILRSTLPLTLAASRILLQATPDSIDLKSVREDIQALPGVVSCHHVHIWQLSDTKFVASLHMQVAFPISAEGGDKYMKLSKMARKCLHAYGIHSATIQPEFCLDKTHDHEDLSTVAGTSPSSSPKCGRLFDGSCLLACVENCQESGCCSGLGLVDNGQVNTQTGHEHAQRNGHNHDYEDDHDHDHSPA